MLTIGLVVVGVALVATWVYCIVLRRDLWLLRERLEGGDLSPQVRDALFQVLASPLDRAQIVEEMRFALQNKPLP